MDCLDIVGIYKVHILRNTIVGFMWMQEGLLR